MTQAVVAPLNPATTDGTDLATKLVNAEQAELTQHSGSSRPSYVVAGMLWLDTTGNPALWKYYDGTSDITLARFNSTSHRMQRPAIESTVASASTADVLGAATDFVAISGTATITSLGSEPLQIKFCRATGAFTLTHHATSLILPTGANIVAAAGDNFIVCSDASGNARVFGYQRATGAALATPAATIPSTTAMLFVQTAAPTGWTKQTTHDDKALRIVSGTASSGGSLNFSTVFGRTATDAYTLLTADIPAHGHTANSAVNDPGHTHGYNSPNSPTSVRQSGSAGVIVNRSGQVTDPNTTGITVDTTISNTGGGGAHSHNMDLRCRYVDCIIAAKD